MDRIESAGERTDDGAWRTVVLARGALISGLVSGAALAIVPQIREIARTLAHDSTPQAGVIAASALSLAAFALGLWALAWAATRVSANIMARRAVAASAALLPVFGAAVGLWRAGADAMTVAIGQSGEAVDSSIVSALAHGNELPQLLTGAGLATAAAGAVLIVLLDRFGPRLTTGLRLRSAVLGLFLFGIALGVVFDRAPTSAPRLIGSLSIVLLFALVASAVLAGLLAIRDRHRVPALSILIAVAALFAWLNVSDNHVPELVARARDPQSNEPKAVVPTVVALQSWLEARKDRAHFEEIKKPYPIFIISAQGGGQYAANLAATFLARAQDRCPNFAQHVFAISGVSGGAIGAGVFSALAKHYATNGPWQGGRTGDLGIGPFEAKANAVLARDYLSPVVAATLFGDLPHAFLPILKRHGDRARTFDAALQSAWDEALPGVANPLKDSYFGLWDAAGAAPAVIANTTQVENGMRVAISPFMSIDSPQEAGTLHQRTRRTVYIGMKLLDEGWEAMKPDEDISLGTALGISARFPWLMPAARFRTSLTEFRLVDGAYIDNSGDETAFDLVSELGQLEAVSGKLADGSEVPRYELHLITLTEDVLLKPGAVQGFGDLLSPLRTMLTTRPTRGQMARQRVRAFLNRAPRLYVGTRYEFASRTPMVMMNQQELQIPLTWQLSETSRKLVAVQAGEAQRCGLASAFEIVATDPARSYEESRAFDHINDLMRSNNCVACSVMYRLSGEKPRDGQPCASE